MANIFKDTPFYENFVNFQNESYFEANLKLKDDLSSFTWKQQCSSNRIDYRFPYQNIMIHIKVKEQNYKKIGFDLGAINIGSIHLNKWFLNFYKNDNHFSLKTGFVKESGNNTFISQCTTSRGAIGFTQIGKLVKNNWEGIFQYNLQKNNENVEFHAKHLLTIKMNPQNQFYFRLFGNRQLIDNCFQCVGNKIGIGYIRQQGCHKFGLDINKLNYAQLLWKIDKPKWEMKHYFDTDQVLIGQITYKPNEQLKISTGLKIPIDKLGKQCPSKYPTGIQIQYNI